MSNKAGQTCSWEALESASIHRYIENGTSRVCNVTGIDLVTLHNAVATILKNLKGRIPTHKIHRHGAVWRQTGIVDFVCHNSKAAIWANSTPVNFKLRFIYFELDSMNRFFYLPHLDMISTNEIPEETELESCKAKEYRADKFLDKYAPDVVDSSNRNSTTKDTANRINKAGTASFVASTLAREYDVSRKVADNFAKEYVDDLEARGLLTEGYTHSASFYRDAIHQFLTANQQ